MNMIAQIVCLSESLNFRKDRKPLSWKDPAKQGSLFAEVELERLVFWSLHEICQKNSGHIWPSFIPWLTVYFYPINSYNLWSYRIDTIHDFRSKLGNKLWINWVSRNNLSLTINLVRSTNIIKDLFHFFCPIARIFLIQHHN